MSMDLYLAPPSGFREWGERELDVFFEADPHPESVELGGHLYVAFVLEAIAYNLEGNMPGSKFPLMRRIGTDENEVVGWHHDEVAPLLEEIRTIRSGLAELPISRSTLQYDSEDDVKRRVTEFRMAHPNRPLINLYHLYYHFIDVCDGIAKRAQVSGNGLILAA